MLALLPTVIMVKLSGIFQDKRHVLSLDYFSTFTFLLPEPKSTEHSYLQYGAQSLFLKLCHYIVCSPSSFMEIPIYLLTLKFTHL